MASKPITGMVEVLSLEDTDYLTAVDRDKLPGTPDQANAKIQKGNLGFAAQADLTAHVGDTSNPHAVTAAQAGADPAGSAATVQGNLDTHIADQTNPHAVTAAQAGADPAGSAAAVQGNLDTHTGAAAPHSGHLIEVQAGTNVTVDNTDPQRPIVSSTGGGATTFLELTDTPADYTGQAGKLVKVDPTENFLIFGDPSGSTVSWGDIQGTLSNQTDLQNELDAKADLAHTHVVADISDFDTEVSTNTDVAANTAARHSAVTVTDTDTVDLTLAGQNVSAAARLQMSLTSDVNGVMLSGDVAAPGNNKVYGTDGSGVKGWKDDPAGGPVTEDDITLSDVTTNDASTARHGFSPKATAPGAGDLNAMAIANGETGRSDKTIFAGCQQIAVVDALPGTPDANTLYFVY